MAAYISLAVAVLVVGWLLWPGRRHAWPVVLIVGDDPERVEGIVRGLSGVGHTITIVGPAEGEVGEIVSRLMQSDLPLVGHWQSIEQALAACDGPAALVLRLDGNWSVRDLMRQF